MNINKITPPRNASQLAAGNVLRLSSFIAHYGFGAKK